MKKKVILVILVSILLIAAIIPSVMATNTDELMLIKEPRATESEIHLDNKTIVNKDVFEFAENIDKKNEVVNGNNYLFGNNVVLENQTINGDLFVLANNFRIENTATINGNVYICAANLKIDGNITRGLYVCAKDVVFAKSAVVSYDVAVAAEHIIIDGNFYRSFRAAVSNLEVSNTANVLGDLNYTSDKEAKVAKGASIKNINFDRYVPKKETTFDIVSRYVLDFTQYFVLTMIVLIILMKFSPKFIEEIKSGIRVNDFGAGIVLLILVPIVFVMFLMLRVTSMLALAGIALFIMLVIISMAISNIAIASLISSRHQNIKLPIATALIAVVSWIAYQIPFVGGIIAFFMITTGIGIECKHFFEKSR